MNRILFTFFILLCTISCVENDLGKCECIEKMTEIIEEAESSDEFCVFEVTLASEYPGCIRYTRECELMPSYSDCPEEQQDFLNAVNVAQARVMERGVPEGFYDCYGL